MKYSHQRELVEGLRAMADFLEENIDLPLDLEPEIKLNVWLYDDSTYYDKNPKTARQKLAEVARILGKAEKEFSGTYFDLVKKFSPCVRIEYTVNREAVCERKVVGTRIVPAGVIRTKERQEEIVEWICTDPILAG